MNILFVCKYNRFRSRVAEVYFNSINKNKNIHVQSAGIIKGNYPLDKREVDSVRREGIDINGKPKGLSTELLRKIDLVIIVASNVPKSIFNYNGFRGKTKVWKVKDITNGESKVLIERRVKKIMRKVRRLVKRLEDKR